MTGQLEHRITHHDPMAAARGESFHWCHMEDAEPCEWCGKIARLKAFYYVLPGGRRRATEGLYCTVNCWRQAHLNV